MSEETFRIVVAAAVLVACLAFVVQAGIVFALFRLTRKMQDQSDGFMQKAEPLLAKVEPVLDLVGPVIEKIGPALDSINAAAAKVGPAIDRFLPVVDHTLVVAERPGAGSRTSPTKPSLSSVPGANRWNALATFSTTPATAPVSVWSRSITPWMPPSIRSKTLPAP